MEKPHTCRFCKMCYIHQHSSWCVLWWEFKKHLYCTSHTMCCDIIIKSWLILCGPSPEEKGRSPEHYLCLCFYVLTVKASRWMIKPGIYMLWENRLLKKNPENIPNGYIILNLRCPIQVEEEDHKYKTPQKNSLNYTMDYWIKWLHFLHRKFHTIKCNSVTL